MPAEYTLFNAALLVSPTGSVLTDPGPLCAGQRATLTCNITGGVALDWNYIDSSGTIRTYNRAGNVVPPSGPVEIYSWCGVHSVSADAHYLPLGVSDQLCG